jgi:hypothetical protein
MLRYTALILLLCSFAYSNPLPSHYCEVISILRITTPVSRFSPLKRTVFKSSDTQILNLKQELFPPYQVYSDYLDNYSFSIPPFYLAHKTPDYSPQQLLTELESNRLHIKNCKRHGPLQLSFRPLPNLLIIEWYQRGKNNGLIPKKQLIEYKFEKDGQPFTLRWKLLYRDFFNENPALRIKKFNIPK